ncbi:MAG: SDR family oxidoreductase [Microscillaceae bacterium]|nr:SDR family oxidoreductase [Microscillaceae bacterium]
MHKIQDKIVLITGGAQGIGKLLGHKCLQEGAKALVIWDLNSELLHQTTEDFRAEGYTVHPYQVDVSQVHEIEAQAARVLNEVGRIDLLFNNAGIVVGKLFKEHQASDIDRTLQINVAGVMHVARVFLPAMLEAGAGHIINIASASSLTPNPKMSVYAASKWAVLGWSESLRLELEREGKDLHVTTVLPSYINTGMFTGVKAPLITPILDPEYISREIIRAVKNNQILLLAPWSVQLLPILRGILPTRVFDFVGGTLFGIYDTMANFIGRTQTSQSPEAEKPAQNGKARRKTPANPA